ncbi:MAG: sugar kinase, partial [Salana multivorans]|nr:sugar kinase [Salana multivorans]
YRAALEATAMGVRHNVETMRAAGADVRRIVAVGGGTQGALWLQIVSDVTGLVQEVPRTTIGASYGAAFLAACAAPTVDADDADATGDGATAAPRIEDWNPVATRITPDETTAATYDWLFGRYLELYAATRDIVHDLARHQRDTSITITETS